MFELHFLKKKKWCNVSEGQYTQWEYKKCDVRHINIHVIAKKACYSHSNRKLNFQEVNNKITNPIGFKLHSWD